MLLKSRRLRDRYEILLRRYSTLSDDLKVSIDTVQVLKDMAEAQRQLKISKANIDNKELSIARYIYYELNIFYSTDIYQILSRHLKTRKVRRVRCAICGEPTYKMFQVFAWTPKSKKDYVVSLCPTCYLDNFQKKC